MQGEFRPFYNRIIFLAFLVVAFVLPYTWAYETFFPQAPRFIALIPSLAVFALYCWQVWAINKKWGEVKRHPSTVNSKDSEEV